MDDNEQVEATATFLLVWLSEPVCRAHFVMRNLSTGAAQLFNIPYDDFH
jgi:hypothetical protein